MSKITKRLVDGLKAGDSDVFAWDSELRGFGVRKKPSGAVSYIVQYRNRQGRSRRLTIASNGRLTAEKARKQAKLTLGEVERGGDPASQREDIRNAPTVGELCDRFLADHAKQHKKPSSAAADARNIRNHIRPILGHLKAADVTRADVDRLKRAIRSGRTAKKEVLGPRRKVIVKGGPGAANRCLALLSKMFNVAEKWGVRPEGSNPCRHVEKYAGRKMERFLSADELACLGRVMAQAHAAKTEPASALNAIWLLLFTGCRLSEILTLQWRWVDFERACLSLPDSKTGAKVVYLSEPALAVLSSIKRHADNPYVIPGDQRGRDEAEPGRHLVNLQKPWRRIRESATLELWKASDDKRLTKLLARLEADPKRVLTAAAVIEAADFEVPRGLLDVRLHDLRHSFASVAVAAGEGLHMVGKLLGHTQAQTTHRYAHLAGDPMKAAADRIGNIIAAAMTGQTAEVVPMTRKEARQ